MLADFEAIEVAAAAGVAVADQPMARSMVFLHKNEPLNLRLVISPCLRRRHHKLFGSSDNSVQNTCIETALQITKAPVLLAPLIKRGQSPFVKHEAEAAKKMSNIEIWTLALWTPGVGREPWDMHSHGESGCS